jgi:hypothetical protein
MLLSASGGTIVNVAQIAAGSLGVLAAAVHGGAGQVLVVSKLSPGSLPATRFGGPQGTKAMIDASWHLTTVAFLAIGAALLVSGVALDGAAARAVGVVGASAFTGFAAVVLGLALAHTPRGLLTHPGPPILTATAVLAWVGAF